MKNLQKIVDFVNKHDDFVAREARGKVEIRLPWWREDQLGVKTVDVTTQAQAKEVMGLKQ